MARPVEFDEDKVLTSAMEQFWKEGYEASSVRKLLDCTGINRGTLYNSFGDIIGIDQKNVMSKNQGKVKQVELLKLNGEIHVIGDGYTDYEIKLAGAATHFFAFKENIERKNVCELSDYILSRFDDYLLFIN